MDENRIIVQCQNGDTEAFRAIYERYSQPLLRTARRMLGNLWDAQDAVQTAFIRLHKSIARFEGRSAFSSYLFRILINVCYDMLKKRQRMKLAPIENVQDPIQNDPTEMIALEQAIDALPPQMRVCFTLFAVEGMRQEDVADILGLSIGGVKSNIFHAKNKLRESLRDERIRQS